ncbi:MAG: asparaginase [Candidatus Limnocylindria bacterium]|nr:asparaginase [Candidatus Limnocylindria bacterium]
MTLHISLLAMGGTISTNVAPAGALPVLGAEELAHGAGGQARDVIVHARDVLRVSGRGITLKNMWDLAEAVRDEIGRGADGIIVTHGTDTLEETAYALALLVDTPVPVVVTGAMRVPGTPGADGPANLAAALAVARNAEFAAFGPLVAFQDEIHAARWVTKTHSTRVAAFSSPAAGPVGYVVEGKAIALLGPPATTDRLPRVAIPDKRVELLWAVAGADGMIVDAIADRVDGLVVAGTGGGHVAPPLADALVRLVRRGCPVVLASRCADGRVLKHTYGGPGSEVHLIAEGLRSAGDLPALKARLRLSFGLSAGMSAPELFPEA